MQRIWGVAKVTILNSKNQPRSRVSKEKFPIVFLTTEKDKLQRTDWVFVLFAGLERERND